MELWNPFNPEIPLNIDRIIIDYLLWFERETGLTVTVSRLPL